MAETIIFLTPTHTQYFDKMKAGEVIEVWSTRNPVVLIWSAGEYNRKSDGNGQLELSEDYNKLTMIKA